MIFKNYLNDALNQFHFGVASLSHSIHSLNEEKTTSHAWTSCSLKIPIIFGIYSFVPSFDVLAFQTVYDPFVPSSYVSFAH